MRWYYILGTSGRYVGETCRLYTRFNDRVSTPSESL